VHGYSSALRIPFHGLLRAGAAGKTEIHTVAYKRTIARRREKKQWGEGKGTRVTAGRSPCSWKLAVAVAQAAGQGACFLIPSSKRGAAQRSKREQTNHQRQRGQRRAGKLSTSIKGFAACLACYLVLLGFFLRRGEALLLLFSFFPDLPPLSLSLLRCCITSLAGPLRIDRERD